ncbi:MAG: 1-deoxy-D-xylulose-5-phosphate reductoisomerase [Clostridia bacterium]|nr:1-deoxy-D-xylulose-5-phosphate reductoisomerase [Clostridia bacterium]
MKKIALLGSTGSIGRQVLQVVASHQDKFKIVSLSAGSNAKLLQEQILAYKPVIATLKDASRAREIQSIPNGTTFYYGENALYHALSSGADILFVALMGFEGLKAVLDGISLGMDIAIANKEVLVAGGSLVTRLAREKGVRLIPVDSEHSAIWQCLDFDNKKGFSRLHITASGGAFRDVDIKDLPFVTKDDALRHPNWRMGEKITVDCATMVNKGLEVIEAKWLFDCPLDKINVVLHRESIIHSMVEFEDGAIMAQMAAPDMRLPIALALSYPQRLDVGVERVNLLSQALTFEEIDTKRYPCFPLVLQAAQMGDNYPCALSAANEEAVKMFLQGRIRFTDIYGYLADCLDSNVLKGDGYDVLKEVDRAARSRAISRFSAKNA